jgi:hypothetical protein
MTAVLPRHRVPTVGWERGQGLAEYALILALILVLSALALLFMGTQISEILSTIAEAI